MVTTTKPDGFIPNVKVSGVLIMCKGELLLIKRSATKQFGANQWAIVGGKVDEGETYFKALVRETQEEVGILLEESWIQKNTLYYHVPDSDKQYMLEYSLYVVSIDEKLAVTLNEENTDFGWFTFDETKELNLIEDALYCMVDILENK